MTNNLKTQLTLEELDLEFEILSLAQQQSIMGGSGGASGGGEGGGQPDPVATLVNEMFSSGGAFGSMTGQASLTLRNSITQLAGSPTGFSLLSKMQTSGHKVNVNTNNGGGNRATYNYDSDTLNMSESQMGDIGLLGHELFHAYDDKKGGSKGTTGTEAQGNIFQFKIMQERGEYNPNTQTAGGVTPIETTSDPNDYYQTGTQLTYGSSMNYILKHGFDKDEFNKVENNIKTGSAANQSPDKPYDNLTNSPDISNNSNITLKEFM